MAKGTNEKRRLSYHNTTASQFVGVSLSVIVELFFSFLAGWAMYDEFKWWGFVPAIIVGVLAGAVFFLLGFYVFILREYAVEANKIFARLRGESADRVGWATFLVVLVMLIESFINANRMIVLPIPDQGAKVFLWLCFQGLVFVPFALGKLVHGHVNARDPQIEERAFYNELDTTFYTKVRGSLADMSLAEIAQLRQGNTAPLHTRIVEEQQQIEAAKQGEKEHPLADGLRTFQPGETHSQNGKTAYRN